MSLTHGDVLSQWITSAHSVQVFFLFVLCVCRMLQSQTELKTFFLLSLFVFCGMCRLGSTFALICQFYIQSNGDEVKW